MQFPHKIWGNKKRNHILYPTTPIAFEVLDKKGALVNLVFCLPSICVLDPESSKKKNHFLTRGLRKHLDHHGSAHLDIKALKMPLKVKIAMVNPGLIKGQNWSKPYQNNIFHFFYSNPRLSEIFINFNQIWPKVDSDGDKKLTLDPTIQSE